MIYIPSDVYEKGLLFLSKCHFVSNPSAISFKYSKHSETVELLHNKTSSLNRGTYEDYEMLKTHQLGSLLKHMTNVITMLGKG